MSYEAGIETLEKLSKKKEVRDFMKVNWIHSFIHSRKCIFALKSKS
jgi:hypothetical protein